ncbi:hypothetical protein N7454_010209 [Penicillium verhagenii]|nr:hypothetical protein N7454_010209 [Penicillium verhagenii]
MGLGYNQRSSASGMWKSKSYLDRGYGSLSTNNNNNDLHYELYGERPTLETIPRLSDQDEVRIRRSGAVKLSLALLGLTCVGILLVMLFTIKTTPSPTSQ